MITRFDLFRILVAILFSAALSGSGQVQPDAKKPIIFDWHAKGEENTEITGQLRAAAPRFEALEIKDKPEKVARQILAVVGSKLMGARGESSSTSDINKFLTFERVSTDNTGSTTVRFKQEYRGVPVYGADVRVHIAKSGTPSAITSKFMPDIGVPVVAEVSPQQAVDIARKHSVEPDNLRGVQENPPKLFIYLHSDARYHLTWLVDLPGVTETGPALWRYFIDAQNGAVLSRYNDLKFQTSAIGRGKGANGEDVSPLYTTQLSANSFVLEDSSLPSVRIKTFDFEYKDVEIDQVELPGTTIRSATNNWDTENGAAVSAHHYARVVFDYFWRVHGRNSLDDDGMALTSSVHASSFRQANPKKWNNALWNGNQMVYGDGDGVRFRSFSGGLDVVAHEFTHGITQYTANLEYRNQPGALNESYSDVFAAMIDTANWEIGEDIVLPRTPGNALRSLEQPARFGQPDHMRAFLVASEENDNGGVHTNSGIPNKVAFLLSAGGTHNSIKVPALGRETTARIYYLTLTKYLSTLSDFEDARRQTLKAAADLYPADEFKQKAIKDAFAAVGIGKATTVDSGTSGRGREPSAPSGEGMIPEANAHAADEITIVAYGDTRTGFFGLGDNHRQLTHKKVVDDILARTPQIDAVLFTGDAVMTNFPLWRKAYWRSFLAQTDRFVFPLDPQTDAPRIPFYPALGNHETYRALPLIMQVPKELTQMQPPQTRDISPGNVGSSDTHQISKAYDAGEDFFDREKGALGIKGERVDPSTSEGARQLNSWITALEYASPDNQNRAAYQLGRFEGALQNSFYSQSPTDRCNDDSRIFQNAYSDLAQYPYLNTLTSSNSADKRSFYAIVIGKGSVKVKVIALDTNCLDFGPQFDFFRNEVSNFSGNIIVVGHHPPIDEKNKQVATWDRIHGWDLYKPYLSSEEGKKIRLWIFGHVHNYQRRGSDVSTDKPLVGPVLLVNGGGGASDLNDAAAPNQWQPRDWTSTFPIVKAYNYTLLRITLDRVSGTVYGANNIDAPMSVIDSFEITLK